MNRRDLCKVLFLLLNGLALCALLWSSRIRITDISTTIADQRGTPSCLRHRQVVPSLSEGSSPTENKTSVRPMRHPGPLDQRLNKAYHLVTCSPDVINPDWSEWFPPVTSTNQVPMETLPFENVTSPNFTVVTLVNPKEQYALCDRLLVRIEARDNLNRPKLYGEDFLRVKLFSKMPYAAVIADKFVDYRNGTYLASLPLVWEGVMHIEVLLVHPAEAIPLFKPSLGGVRAYAYGYIGEFEMVDDTGVRHSENVSCSESPPKVPYCNYSQLHVHSPFYCNMPHDGDLSCSHWKGYHQDVENAFQQLRVIVRKNHVEEILKIARRVIPHSIGPITVTDKNENQKDSVKHVSLESLPYCRTSDPLLFRPNGFFFQEYWIPFSCKIVYFTDSQARECLQGKTVRFYGDSTVEQLYLRLSKRAECSEKDLPPPRDNDRREKLCQSQNATLYFHFHGIPNGFSHRDHLRYAETEIDNIIASSNQVIVLSYWTHFGFTGLSSLEKRVRGIREAIHRLKARSPDLKVVVKGANTRDYRNTLITLVSSDWHTYRQEMKLREMFRNDGFVGFVHAWDITQAQQFPAITHPSKPIVDIFINFLLTYICID